LFRLKAAQTRLKSYKQLLVYQDAKTLQTVKGEYKMANCGDMCIGDVLECKTCGLELKVEKTCSCGEGGTSCHESLECCGKEMLKK